MANKKISELPFIGNEKISGNTLVPLVTYYSATTGTTVHTFVSDFQEYILSGQTITGGTYSSGTATFTNNSGGTFTISGFTESFTGGTVIGPTFFTSGLTTNSISATTYLNLPLDLTITGFSYSNNTFTLTNSSGDTLSTSFNQVTGLTINGDLTVTGNTNLQTVSATTYLNLPVDVFVTGGTYSSGTTTFTNNTGGTFNLTGLTSVNGSSPQVGFFSSGTNLTGSNNFVYSGGTLQVVSTGNTSSAVPLIVRNSSNNKNIMEVRGDSETRFNGLPVVGNYVAIKNYNSYDANIDLMGGDGVKVQLYNDVTSYGAINRGFNIWNPGIIGSATSKINNVIKSGLEAYGAGYGFNWAITSNSSGIFSQSDRSMWLTHTKSLVLYTGSDPIDTFSEKTDSFEMYSKDVMSGKAVPHFRTEDGDIVKLYTHSAVTTSQGIANVLTTLGLLSASTIDTDVFVTGGTFSGGVITFTNNSGGTFGVSGISSFDTLVTGFTYSNNTFTISQNSGTSFDATFNSVTGLTVNGNLSVTGNTNLNSFTGTSAVISGSGQNILTVIGSGNSTNTPLFNVQGSQNTLFSVVESSTFPIINVNNIAGNPVVRVFSDNSILWGSNDAPSLNTTVKISASTGTTTIYTIPQSGYTGAFFEYTVMSPTGARAGSIMSIFSGSSVQYTETTTNDIGSTTGLTFSMSADSTNALLQTSATTSGWVVKTIVRGI